MEVLNQAKNLIEKAQNILIIPAQNLDGDILGNSLALFYTLKKIEKNVHLLLNEIPEKFKFLENFNKNFVISIDTTEKEVKELRYEKNDKDLKIYLSLNRGEIKKEDLFFSSPLPCRPTLKNWNRPNLLITLGANTLEDLGEIFEKNPDLFYQVPILNIDHHPANENFGEVNLIDIKCCSLAEIITDLISEKLLDKNIATSLLTAVISASQNFQNSRTRPQTLELASFLIEKGADHQKIIQHLYKTKNISQVRLLGRILEKLNFDEKKGLYWATLRTEDFQETSSSSKDLGFAIEELKFSFWRLPAFLLLWESHASSPLVKGVFYSLNPEGSQKILENFEGVCRGEGVLFLIRDQSLESAKEKVLAILS